MGWKLELVLSGAAHSTFTDFPLIAQAYALREKSGRQGKELLGTVVGIRSLETVAEYVSAFARQWLTGSDESLLQPNGSSKCSVVEVKRFG